MCFFRSWARHSFKWTVNIVQGSEDVSRGRRQWHMFSMLFLVITYESRNAGPSQRGRFVSSSGSTSAMQVK